VLLGVSVKMADFRPFLAAGPKNPPSPPTPNPRNQAISRSSRGEPRSLCLPARSVRKSFFSPKYLNGLSRRGEAIWLEIEGLIATTQPKGYERAVQMLVDLKDVAARKPGGFFAQRLDALRAVHAHKPALLRRLIKAGL
jgi:hypothetical protein